MSASILFVLACGSGPTVPPAPPPSLDQPAWLAELRARRPELVTRHAGSVKDPAWQALVIRPRHRAELAAKDATYDAILAREYAAEERAGDGAWARSLRDAQRSFVPTATVAPAGYDLRAYTGYRVGSPTWDVGDDGLVLAYKAFFEFADFRRSLAADRYAGFVARLDALGFRGDSKIDLRPGQVRFQYNNLIVHAPTLEMALCAEAAGVAYFGAEIAHVARGVDAVVDGRPTDWHHFLLTGRYDELPDEVKAFVAYAGGAATLASCAEGGPVSARSAATRR